MEDRFIMAAIALAFGVLLIVWGAYRIRKDSLFIGKNRKSSNLFSLLIHGQASGIGQVLSGIVMVVLAIIIAVIQ